MSKLKPLLITDTTLRDGEQAPGVSFDAHQKLDIAKQLERLNVDIIEVSFPAASPQEIEATKLVAKHVKNCYLRVIARANRQDIDLAAEAAAGARLKRIVPFVSSSPIHRKYKLGKSRRAVLQMMVDAIRYSKTKFDSVDFAFEDATRTEFDFLLELVRTAVDEGVEGMPICDTVGISQPTEFFELITRLLDKVPELRDGKSYLTTHCHNDMGNAVANSLAGIKAGCRGVEGTMTGIGERAGNVPLEEVIMNVLVRKDYFQRSLNVDTTLLAPTCRLVSKHSGVPIAASKPVIGANAFAHEAGVHQDGIFKYPKTYEIVNPHAVGVEGRRIILGKLSGRTAFDMRMRSLGFRLSTKRLDEAFVKFKALTSRKPYPGVADLRRIGTDSAPRSGRK